MSIHEYIIATSSNALNHDLGALLHPWAKCVPCREMHLLLECTLSSCECVSHDTGFAGNRST